MKNTLRKSLIFLLVFVLMASMNVTAFAATGDQNETPEAMASSITKASDDERIPSQHEIKEFSLKTFERKPFTGLKGAAEDAEIAASGVCGDNANFTIDMNGKLVITGTGSLYDCEDEWDMWLLYSSSITEVVIEEGITGLGSGAFYECQFKSIQMPDSLTSIGEGAFVRCTVEEAITIGKNVKTIGDYAFQGTSTPAVNIPASVKNVGTFTFVNNRIETFSVESSNTVFTSVDGAICKNSGKTLIAYPCGSTAESFKVSNTVTTIDSYAFMNAINLKYIDLNNVKTINEMAFWLSGLEKLTIPSTVTAIKEYAFAEIETLKTVTIGNGLKTIAEGTFAYCTALETLKLGSKIETIEFGAFYDCTALGTVTIPESVTYIDDAFPESVTLKFKNKNLKPCGENSYAILDTVKISNKRYYDKAYEVLTKVNNERAKKGLNKLKMDKSLLETAMARAAETAVCFSHTRSDGTDCFSANSKMIAENIAAGQSTATQVMNSWMNSSGHKANILSENATSIGIGCIYHNGTYYWVQCFGNTSPSSFSKPSNKTVTSAINLAQGLYKPYIKVKTKKVKAGNTQNATFIIPNATVAWFEAKVQPGSVDWSSSNDKCSVTAKGVIKGHASGKSRITGKLTHYKASKVVNVTGSITTVTGKCKYKVTGSKSVSCYVLSSKKAASITIKGTVKIKGTTYNVTSIQKNAFKNASKLKTISISSTKITSIGKGAFKGINKKATIKVPASCLEKYTNLIKNSGVSSSVKIVAK